MKFPLPVQEMPGGCIAVILPISGLWLKDDYPHVQGRRGHILSYELNVKKLDEGMHALHSCDRKWCVNFEHLREGTKSDNMKDVLDRQGPAYSEALREGHFQSRKYKSKSQRSEAAKKGWSEERRKEMSKRMLGNKHSVGNQNRKGRQMFKDPQVTVLAATENDPVRAAALLIFSKHTRLNMSPGGLEAIRTKAADDPEWMLSELNYMSKTIRSSWELLDITFMIENVSRACAQQITRTRQASYAMQSTRVSDVRGTTFHRPADLKDEAQYKKALQASMDSYVSLVDSGEKLEDARGVLPMNVHCNLVAKYNLRTLADLLPARTSYRAQGEYNEVARQMKEAILEMWPWAEMFFRPRHEIANTILDELMAAAEKGASVHEIKILASKAKDSINGADK